MVKLKRFVSTTMIAAMMSVLVGCQGQVTVTPTSPDSESAQEAASASDSDAGEKAAEEEKKDDADASKTEESKDETKEEAKEDTAETEKGDIYILYTSDVHCGIDQGFGYVGLQQVRDQLEAQGYTTILVDDGDSIQGESIGTLTKGEAIIDIMNDMNYDVVIPGNHEFDYGMDRFLELTEKANFPYISCNFTKEDELVFEPYKIIEAAGTKIGFVGVTTPTTLIKSKPMYFQNEKGEYIYGFMEDETGQKLYDAVQKAVDDCRAEGVDYVYVLGHLGLEEQCTPWTYADVIANTNGIDVFLDGHSHDTEQIVMKNKDGEDVPRSACGTKMVAIGYSYISAEEGIKDTNIWIWPNDTSVPELLGVENKITEVIDAAKAENAEQLNKVVAKSEVELTINDPKEVDDKGNPIRMIRRAETNLGDLCADAIRKQTDADIAIMNAGGIRVSMKKGDITFGDIISVFPFGNSACIVNATGQQILDALEWGARSCPGESGGFLQVSGMTYEIDTTIESTCTFDDKSMFTGITGERRVKNVKVGDEPIDPKKTYKLGGINYTILNNGDGFTTFKDAEIIDKDVKLDNQLLIDFIVDDLGGTIGEEYADPYGQGRITITE